MRRSRRLVAATVCGHLLALVALASWSGPPPAALLAALGVGASLIRALRQPWPVRLSLIAGGGWELARSDGRVFRGHVIDGRVAAGVISITLSGRAGGPVLLLADALRDGDRTGLCGLLRHGCGAATC